MEDFSEDHLHKDFYSYMWSEEPFIVSVQCQKIGRGFVADWWVSGTAWEDEIPTLILRFRHGLEIEKEHLRPLLKKLWDTWLMDLSFETAMVGGITNTSKEINELPEKVRQQILRFHLWGHDKLGHFNIKGDTKVEKTANQYLMLKTFGSTQPQKAIADSESYPFLGEVSPATINQRLAMAKKLGFLPKVKRAVKKKQTKPLKKRGAKK